MILDQDSDGDLRFTDGKLVKKTGAEETAIRMRNRLFSVRGEWHRDTTVGIPYFQVVFVKRPDLGIIRRVFVEALLAVPGVKSIKRLTLNVDKATRTLSVEIEAVHDSGAIITGGTGKPFVVEDMPTP